MLGKLEPTCSLSIIRTESDDPFIEEQFKVRSSTRTVHMRGNSTMPTNFSPPKSTVQGFSSQAWDEGQTVSIMKPPFAPSLQGGATFKVSATKHTDLWLPKAEFYYDISGKIDKTSVCFKGEPVVLNKTGAVLSSSHGLCSENIRYRGNDLVIFYGCSKKVLGAENVFDKMYMRTFASWNSIVSTHMCDSDANYAVMLCDAMEEYICLIKFLISTTAQKTVGVQGVDSVPENFVVEQLKLVLLNSHVYVVKTDMLLSLVERTQVLYWWFDRGKSKDINDGSHVATIQGLCSFSSLEDKTGFEGAALLGPKVEIGLTAHGHGIDVAGHGKVKYALLRDTEDYQMGLYDKPLPFFGCGIGWFSFLFGFLCPPMWYYATILYFGNHYRKDPRERAGLGASAITAGICTVALLIIAAILLLRWWSSPNLI